MPKKVTAGTSGKSGSRSETLTNAASTSSSSNHKSKRSKYSSSSNVSSSSSTSSPLRDIVSYDSTLNRPTHERMRTNSGNINQQNNENYTNRHNGRKSNLLMRDCCECGPKKYNLPCAFSHHFHPRPKNKSGEPAPKKEGAERRLLEKRDMVKCEWEQCLQCPASKTYHKKRRSTETKTPTLEGLSVQQALGTLEVESPSDGNESDTDSDRKYEVNEISVAELDSLIAELDTKEIGRAHV